MIFAAAEMVYAYHGPMVYKARVMSIRDHAEKPYRIHYHGWNKKFDEWVAENRILKMNQENKEFASALQLKFKDVKPKTKKQQRKENKAGVSNDSTSFLKFIPVQNITLFFGIPESLKEVLIDDRENIVIDNFLVDYITCVDNIVQEYKKTIIDQFFYLNEYLDGLVAYFNIALPCQLLYLFERPQLKQYQLDQNFKPSQKYGLQHFLRLFTVLPSIMPFSNLNDALKEEFQQFTEDLLQWLGEHLEYAGKYTKATDKYISSFEEILESK